jgi:hypothetical protein
MMQFLKINRFYFLGAAVGMGVGFTYWKFVGCASGGCAVTSKPLNSTLYFGLIGALVGGMFLPRKPKPSQP